MSSRVLRKLHGGGDIGIGLPGGSGTADEGSDAEAENAVPLYAGTKKKQNINPFDLLNDHSNCSSASEDQEEENHETEASLALAEDQQDIGKRKKKRKRKKSSRQQSNARSSEDNIEDDEVERSVREVNRILGEAAPAPSTSQNSNTSNPILHKSTLGVEHKHLNPSNELKRIFGSKIVQAETRKRRSRGTNRTLKLTWLVTPKENWPQIGKLGLSMKLTGSENGIFYFSFEHSAAYQAIEMRFLEAVESMHPNNIVAVINTYPYHVSSLLQLSDICRMNEDLVMAAEFTERALFALECAFHPSFYVASGHCRLDYRKQQNRALYVALFKHILFVGGRACYRTALEFCKLLLSLDPEKDPLAIVLAMDFYALKAREFQWLINFSEEWEPRRNLSQLPNIAFSVAVAHFLLSRSDDGMGDTSHADTLLQEALIMFPGALQQILDKCSVQVDSRVSAHTYFTVNASKNQSQALAHLIELYVVQSYHVWKEPHLLPWLERNVHKVLDRVDRNDPVVTDAESKRGIRYVGTLPPNILRFILLCDRKDLSPQGLPANHMGPIMSFDPLPPSDSIDLYTRPPRSRQSSEANVFTNFFRSLFPHFNIEEADVYVPDDAIAPRAEDNIEDGGIAYDLRTSVRNLMERMRDLMANVGNNSDENDFDEHETDDM